MDALLAVAAFCGVLDAERIELAGRELHVRDIADLSCVAPESRTTLGDLVVARVPEGRPHLTASRAALAALVRRRVPTLSGMSAGRGAITIMAPATAASHAPSRSCFATRKPIHAGDAISEELLAKAPCAEPAQRNLLGYDRSEGVVRARIDVPAGVQVGAILVSPELTADTNDQVAYRIRNGATTVERFVTAAQPTLGPRTFVRTAAGQVFSAPSSALTEAGAAP